MSARSILVRVIARSKKELVKQEGQLLKVYTNSPAIDGKANEAVIGLLAKYFNVKKSRIEIVKGEKSRNKVVIIF